MTSKRKWQKGNLIPKIHKNQPLSKFEGLAYIIFISRTYKHPPGQIPIPQLHLQLLVLGPFLLFCYSLIFWTPISYGGIEILLLFIRNVTQQFFG